MKIENKACDWNRTHKGTQSGNVSKYWRRSHKRARTVWKMKIFTERYEDLVKKV